MAGATKDSRKKRTDGEGSIYQRHSPGCTRRDGKCDCKWVGALVLEYRNGKPVRKRVTAATKSGAATKLRDVRAKHEAQTLPVGKTPTVEQWMNHWLNNIAARKVGELTLNNSYRQKTRDYIIPLLGQHRLDRLTPDHIEAAWDTLADVGNPLKDDPTPLAANTVHQTHAILRRALKVAVQRKKLRTNPAGTDSMDAPAADEGEIASMTLDEVRKVLTASEGRRNAARWSVALALGLRQGEALGLPWWDPTQPEQGGLDLDDGVIRVRRALKRVKGKGLVYGPVKSKASKRDLQVPEQLLALLRAHRKAQNSERLEAGTAWEDHGLVFCQQNGRPIDPSRDYQAWKRLLKAAGVKHYRLHAARHSAATLLMLQDVQPRVVQGILGHSQISVTMRYQHAVDELKKDAAARMGAALWG
ncbi:MAG TPA: tyrosine-type recombinase/integrase [Acidimicrobiales bacterium]|nr:tyrosine-type recombinase/integrase [Acidimicrobiales bacterium]